jgi:hypothetical protein
LPAQDAVTSRSTVFTTFGMNASVDLGMRARTWHRHSFVPPLLEQDDTETIVHAAPGGCMNFLT